MIVPLPQTGQVVPIMLSSADGSLVAGCGEAAAFFVDAVDDVAADFAAAFFGAAVFFFFAFFRSSSVVMLSVFHIRRSRRRE